MRFAHTVTVLALPIAILASSSGADQAASTRGPRFERTPCAAEVVAEERIECGTLAVPENRRKADSGRFIYPW